jgi:hypothetical protein
MKAQNKAKMCRAHGELRQSPCAHRLLHSKAFAFICHFICSTYKRHDDTQNRGGKNDPTTNNGNSNLNGSNVYECG